MFLIQIYKRKYNKTIMKNRLNTQTRLAFVCIYKYEGTSPYLSVTIYMVTLNVGHTFYVSQKKI